MNTPQRRDLLVRVLSFVGIGIVIVALAQSNKDFVHPWAFIVTVVAIAAWVLRVVTPSRWTVLQTTVLIVMVAGGAVATIPTNSIAVIPVIAGVLFAVSRPQIGRWFAVAIVFLSIVLVAIGALFEPITAPGLISIEAGIVLAALIGFTRRQARAAELQAQALAEERLLFREEQARTAVLAERSRIARDIHDVLAHSLGGLVIQLDAVDALLEAGKIAEARSRVRDARSLAASGLGDARRAVDALRESAEPVEVSDAELRDSLLELVDAHRSLGGEVAFTESGAARMVSGEQAEALRRALQEALSNARKHAPGIAVGVHLLWMVGEMGIDVSNRVPEVAVSGVLATSGGGHGLAGMRERFAALPGGRVFAGEHKTTDGAPEFVISVRTELS